jgi:hypothetical protein
VRVALVADGSSDRTLIPVIRWTLSQCAGRAQMGQPAFYNRDVGKPLLDEMRRTIELFVPDILFVHRDGETATLDARRAEIPDIDVPLVRVVPIRMTEAWLLFDEAALRVAAGNPRGRCDLGLPDIRRAEEVADPKARLRDALLAAAEVAGRRRKRLLADLPAVVHRVAELIADFAPLRRLSAFSRFQDDCHAAFAEVTRRRSQ